MAVEPHQSERPLGARAPPIPSRLIPQFAELREIYPPLSGLPPAAKREFATSALPWNLSCLPGWEFLLRYVLLLAVIRRWPRYGWWWVPLAETLYHLQKPLPETAAILLFSIILTRWALARRNGLLPALRT